jgi:hypothetical protein
MTAAQRQIAMVPQTPEVDAQYLIANIERSLAQLKAIAEHQAVVAKPIERWLTIAEAAEHTNYGITKINTLVAEGVLPCHRITPNSDPRFLASELNAALKSKKG